MSETPKQSKELIARIESGEYYKDARKWYDVMYLRPISQRVFYIVVSGFSVAFFFMAFSSITNLLPISPRIPFVYRNADFLEEIPRMERFKAANEQADPALMRYFVGTYVKMREGYSATTLAKSQAFVRSYSSDTTLREYAAQISQNNPQSPIRRYGRFRDLAVELNGFAVNAQQTPMRAEVDFSTSVIGGESLQKTNWTAVVTFEYTNLVVRNTYDDSLGDYVLDYDEPTFKVLSYERRERLSGIR